jgi:hypothetical protein
MKVTSDGVSVSLPNRIMARLRGDDPAGKITVLWLVGAPPDR